MTILRHLTRQHIVTADVTTLNNHLYPLPVLERLTKLPAHTINGYIGIIDDCIAIDHLSHVITSLYLEGSELYADIDILDIPWGVKLIKLLDEEQIVFRLQGYASVKEKDGIYIVNDDYHLTAINAISTWVDA